MDLSRRDCREVWYRGLCDTLKCAGASGLSDKIQVAKRRLRGLFGLWCLGSGQWWLGPKAKMAGDTQRSGAWTIWVWPRLVHESLGSWPQRLVILRKDMDK